jgi:hypothetical protein
VLSTTVIERPFTLIVVDCTGGASAPEADLTRRLLTTLAKRGVTLASAEPIAPPLEPHASALDAASCIVLVGDSARTGVALEAWRWLDAHVTGPALVVAAQLGDPDPALTDALLQAPPHLAPIALAQQTPATPRATALFLMKLLAELHLHTDDHRITGRMAWFAHRKAAELLKRRRLDGAWGLRA